MAVGFGDPDVDGVLFAVYPDSDGFLPIPSSGEGNLPGVYQASIRLTDGTAVSDLRALKSIVTQLPAIGQANGGTLVIEGGAGVRVLTFPSANGSELTADAILTAIAQTAHMMSDDRRLDVTFLIVE